MTEFDFTDIEIVEENECDFCGRWIEVGEEIPIESTTVFTTYYICPKCYEETQTGQMEPLEM